MRGMKIRFWNELRASSSPKTLKGRNGLKKGVRVRLIFLMRAEKEEKNLLRIFVAGSIRTLLTERGQRPTIKRTSGKVKKLICLLSTLLWWMNGISDPICPLRGGIDVVFVDCIRPVGGSVFNIDRDGELSIQMCKIN